MNCPIDWILLLAIPVEVIVFGIVWFLQRNEINRVLERRWDPHNMFDRLYMKEAEDERETRETREAVEALAGQEGRDAPAAPTAPPQGGGQWVAEDEPDFPPPPPKK